MTHFEQALEKIKEVHAKKAKDYTDEREFGNFEDAAKHANISVHSVIETLIGTKESRRRNLEHSQTQPVNESIEDTLLDRAVYCLIRYAHYKSLTSGSIDLNDVIDEKIQANTDFYERTTKKMK